MPFISISENIDNESGNFPEKYRILYNLICNRLYLGNLKFKNNEHVAQVIPILADECLEDKPETYKLIKAIRKAMKISLSESYEIGPDSPVIVDLSKNSRSIHQNDNGNLPYKKDSVNVISVDGCNSPLIHRLSKSDGKLPNKQVNKDNNAYGHFMEFTCGDDLCDYCRLVIDYRFGIMYITFGHYHKQSFALLARSMAEVKMDIIPTLSMLNVDVVDINM